ncbi:MAG: hypothetical protein N2327_02790 [Caldimicrobium sp.]|nr:hypothetical protein [Caldimicrobium sp.]MCX7873348.1 hypothetical protein [Caldimicrobium sp.]MDW8093414.1 hypothetical protein [Caldimicrobium sp.]
MQRLPLSFIRPGMRTYEEVLDSQGRVLCGKGIEITEEMLKRFQDLGVSYITVEGTPVKLPWEKSLDEELQALEERFKGVEDETLLQIKEIIKELLFEKFKIKE